MSASTLALTVNRSSPPSLDSTSVMFVPPTNFPFKKPGVVSLVDTLAFPSSVTVDASVNVYLILYQQVVLYSGKMVLYLLLN